jgi:hypothetical protein
VPINSAEAIASTQSCVEPGSIVAGYAGNLSRVLFYAYRIESKPIEKVLRACSVLPLGPAAAKVCNPSGWWRFALLVKTKHLTEDIFQQRQAPVARYPRKYDDHDDDQNENGHYDFIFQDVLSVED